MRRLVVNHQHLNGRRRRGRRLGHTDDDTGLVHPKKGAAAPSRTRFDVPLIYGIMTLEDQRMSIDLSSDSEAFLGETVSRGFFPSQSAALEAAVDLLRERQELLERIDVGRRQLEKGEYLEFDREGLREFFDGLLDRARQRAGQQHD
jgi:Arc/MetJ-type ribon-helix-helix transcriptional regulator